MREQYGLLPTCLRFSLVITLASFLLFGWSRPLHDSFCSHRKAFLLKPLLFCVLGFELKTCNGHADSGTFISEGAVNTFGCACRVDESNTLIDSSEAGELVRDNSQWHPGFSAMGSVPGMLPNGTIALQTGVQATAVTTADQDFEIEDEGEDESEDESEGEADEEMHDIDNLDDAFDEDPPDEGEEGDVTALLAVDLGVISSQLSDTPGAAEIEQLLPDENGQSEDEDSDLPDLEEIPVADQTDQQTTEGNV